MRYVIKILIGSCISLKMSHKLAHFTQMRTIFALISVFFF
jgi:hypothetical protein